MTRSRSQVDLAALPPPGEARLLQSARPARVVPDIAGVGPLASDSELLSTLLRQIASDMHVLAALQQDVRRVLDLVDDGRPARRLAPADRELLERLLPATGGLVGSEPFAVVDVLEEAATPAGAGLRVVLGPLDRWTPKRLGKLLARGAGIAVDGYRVERLGGSDRAGVLWRVVIVGP